MEQQNEFNLARNYVRLKFIWISIDDEMIFSNQEVYLCNIISFWNDWTALFRNICKNCQKNGNIIIKNDREVFLIALVNVCRRGSPLLIGVKSDTKLATDHIPVMYSKGEYRYESRSFYSRCPEALSYSLQFSRLSVKIFTTMFQKKSRNLEAERSCLYRTSWIRNQQYAA